MKSDVNLWDGQTFYVWFTLSITRFNSNPFPKSGRRQLRGQTLRNAPTRLEVCSIR